MRGGPVDAATAAARRRAINGPAEDRVGVEVVDKGCMMDGGGEAPLRTFEKRS